MSKKTDVISALTQPLTSEMIDLVRIRKHVDTSVEYLREKMSISRSTADKVFNALNNKEELNLVYRSERRALIRGEAAYFLGISIGSRYIRIALIGLDFEPVALEDFFPKSIIEEKLNTFVECESCAESYTFERNSESDDKLTFIRDTVRYIVTHFLDRAETDSTFSLFGIGFGVAGPVDYDAQVWRSSTRINNLHNITIADLVGYENKKRIDNLELFISIDNNAKAAAVSEYQYLMEKTNGQYDEDLAIIYVGSGIGLAVVVDGKLLRGSTNMSCELGHVPLLFTETKDNNDKFAIKTVEDILFDEQKYTTFLPYVLNFTSCMFGIGRFILVGHSISRNEKLTSEIMDQRLKFTVAPTQTYCSAENGRCNSYTTAIGAAIEAYFTLRNYSNQVNARTNLAHDISWKRESSLL